MAPPVRPKAIGGAFTSDGASVYNPEFLRLRTRWIRDDLDPQVARDGPDALHADDILKLDEFLRHLLITKVTIDTLRYSRIHLAILLIAGHGTRWPNRLIERCDALNAAWSGTFGPLEKIGISLYEEGGRLHGICTPEDIAKEKLVVKWIKSGGGAKLNPFKALNKGDLGFTPGDWWISPLFAYLDGIIDHASLQGGVVADSTSAYALVLSGNHEVASLSPDDFVYRAKFKDKGRYRLTAATPESRIPIRILRSHTLRSFWAPKAGLRYDGLYQVKRWSIQHDNESRNIIYDISFKRLSGQASMEEVLCRPWTEEIEDYKEFKRLRLAARAKIADSLEAAVEGVNPIVRVSADGSMEEEVVGTADSVIASSSESEPEWQSLRRNLTFKMRLGTRQIWSVSPKTSVGPQ